MPECGLAALLIVVFTCSAVRGNTLVAWGQNGYGQTNIPSDLTNVVAISAAGYFDLGLRADGTVIAWGSGGVGQTNIPVGLSNVVAISAGGSHCLALKHDGTIVAWGKTNAGQSSVAVGITNIVAISAGGDHNLALACDGKVFAWGDNTYGQTDIPASATNVSKIAAGGAHSVVLRRDGSMICWGLNNYGQVTNVPNPLTNVLSISAGGFHTLAQLGDGTLRYWGVVWNYPTMGSNAPSMSNATAISAGANSSLAIHTDGRATAGGIPGSGYGLATVPEGISNVVAVSAAQGSVSVIGANACFALGYHNLLMTGDGRIHLDAPFAIHEQSWGGFLILSAKATGPLPLSYQWQHNGFNMPGATQENFVLPRASRKNSGTYAVIVANSNEAVTNDIATVVVRVPQILSGPQFDENGHCSILSGDADGSSMNETIADNFELLVSTNLQLWCSVLSTPVHTNGLLRFEDLGTEPSLERFYRVVER